MNEDIFDMCKRLMNENKKLREQDVWVLLYGKDTTKDPKIHGVTSSIEVITQWKEKGFPDYYTYKTKMRG